MIDLPVLVLFQQTNGLALHDSASLQALTGNEVAIHVVPIRCARPYNKAIRIGIRSRNATCTLVRQGFFIIPMLLAGTRCNFDAYLDHTDLSPTHLSWVTCMPLHYKPQSCYGARLPGRAPASSRCPVHA